MVPLSQHHLLQWFPSFPTLRPASFGWWCWGRPQWCLLHCARPATGLCRPQNGLQKSLKVTSVFWRQSRSCLQKPRNSFWRFLQSILWSVVWFAGWAWTRRGLWGQLPMALIWSQMEARADGRAQPAIYLAWSHNPKLEKQIVWSSQRRHSVFSAWRILRAKTHSNFIHLLAVHLRDIDTFLMRVAAVFTLSVAQRTLSFREMQVKC